MNVSHREEILEELKAVCEKIKVENGFNNNVYAVYRKMVTYDNPSFNFPILMVLGGEEVFEDDFSPQTGSRLRVKIRGYTKDEDEPEVAMNSLIRDVMKILDSDENPYWKNYRPVSLDTDEGWLSTEMNGLALFELTLEILYWFDRTSP